MTSRLRLVPWLAVMCLLAAPLRALAAPAAPAAPTAPAAPAAPAANPCAPPPAGQGPQADPAADRARLFDSLGGLGLRMQPMLTLSPVLPSGADSALATDMKDPGDGATLRVLVARKHQAFEATGVHVFAGTDKTQPPEPDHAGTNLTFDFDDTLLSHGWRAPATLYVIACRTADNALLWEASQPITVSTTFWPVIISVAVTVILYIAAALAAALLHKKPDGSRKYGFWRCLDPVVLTEGSDGRGSLSKLQLLFFSVLVFYLILYILLRIGLIEAFSQTVLLLLGISAVGAAASKATDVSKTRLDGTNWGWLIARHWLPQGGVEPHRTARLGDLLVVDGEFNVYHFQMLIFSLAVGVSLLFVGLNELSAYTIPDTMLGVLGLSQVVYVGGKLVAPPGFDDLDKAITKLREQEAAFWEAAAKANAGVAPATVAQAQQLAAKEYRDFKLAVVPAQKLAQSVLDYRPPVAGADAAVLEPAFG